MKRRPNLPAWAGFAIVIVAFISYVPFFALFPATRDIPWANYLLFLVGGALLAIGVRRAFRDPQRPRGRITASLLALLSVLTAALFVAGILYSAKQIPPAENALRLGQSAPLFVLPNTAGKPVALADLLKAHRAVLLVFYRGYW